MAMWHFMDGDCYYVYHCTMMNEVVLC